VNGLPSADQWRPVERISIVAPLGIRFWDPAFDVPVDDGLQVTAYPFGAAWPPTAGYRTPSGIYAFRGVPGLHDVEYPQGDPPSPGSLPASRRYQIVVADAQARFLPVSFAVDAPFRGIFPTDLASSLGSAPPGFYLFSAPTRAGSPLVGVVRAQLSERLDAVNERPAAYAVIEVDAPGGDTWIGIADQRGVAALLFPYPTFTASGSASLPASLPSGTGSQQSWPVTVRVLYQPSALTVPVGGTLPELRSILAQAPGALWTERASPPGVAAALLPATLVFGQELVLGSAGESVLLVGPGSLP
jgi:hypothetical protein